MFLPKLSYNLIAYENSDIRDNIYDISIFTNENKSTKERLISCGIEMKILYSLNKSKN